MGKKSTTSPVNPVPGKSIGRIIAVLRATLNWSQTDLARKSGVKRASISAYEAGATTPDAATLGRLLSAMGFRWSVIDATGSFLGRLCAEQALRREHGSQAAETLRLADDIQELAARLDQIALLLHDYKTQRPNAEPATAGQDERSAAKALWARAKKFSRNKLKDYLETVPASNMWALCELVCHESQQRCADDLDQASFLAELAVSLAERVSGDEGWLNRLRGYAVAHVGNVLRVRGDHLAPADRTFAAAIRLWEAGGTARNDLLEAGMIWALLASLRRAQRRFNEAAELLERAFLVSQSPMFRVQVLTNKAKLHEKLGELEKAVAILVSASEISLPLEEGRVILCVRHNLADNLSKLGRYEEADALLPEVRALSLKAGGELDRVRRLWTEGRIAAGLGRVEEGIEVLIKVRGEFASLQMHYDTALVSLELAVLYAKESKTSEVKSLARHMVPIFRSQDVHREALAALTLFRQAAEAEKVTEEFARGILVYLLKARSNPELKFAPDSMAV